MEHCLEFTHIWDEDGSGVIERDEMVDFCKFMLMYECMQNDPALREEVLMKQEAEDILVAQIEEEERVYDSLDELNKSRAMVAKVMDKLPGWVTEMINGTDFAEHCADMFTKIDADGNGVLDVQELYPLIVELLNEHPMSVTEMHCQEFVEMFDSTDRGVIGKDDFKDFVKF